MMSKNFKEFYPQLTVALAAAGFNRTPKLKRVWHKQLPDKSWLYIRVSPLPGGVHISGLTKLDEATTPSIDDLDGADSLMTESGDKFCYIRSERPDWNADSKKLLHAEGGDEETVARILQSLDEGDWWDRKSWRGEPPRPSQSTMTAKSPASVPEAQETQRAAHDDEPSTASPNFGARSNQRIQFGGETRVLMGDGSTKPIFEIAVGDFVIAQDPVTHEVSANPVL
jgi:hypothetical protein